MYEGWHIEFTDHARRRLLERGVKQRDVLALIEKPDSAEDDVEHGGKLLSRYLPDWDRMLVIAVEERIAESVLLVKTVLWLQVS